MGADYLTFNRAAHDRVQRPDPPKDPEQLISAYFSSDTVGLCVLDSNLRCLSINDALAEMSVAPSPPHLGNLLRETMGGIADQIELHARTVFDTGEQILNCAILDRYQPARGLDYGPFTSFQLRTPTEECPGLES